MEGVLANNGEGFWIKSLLILLSLSSLVIDVSSSCDCIKNFYRMHKQFQGCYSDQLVNSDFQAVSMHSLRMSNNMCARFCHDEGYDYSATHNQYECFCADSFDASANVAMSLCTCQCPGDCDSMKCGCEKALRIYKLTGVKKVHRRHCKEDCEMCESDEDGIGHTNHTKQAKSTKTLPWELITVKRNSEVTENVHNSTKKSDDMKKTKKLATKDNATMKPKATSKKNMGGKDDKNSEQVLTQSTKDMKKGAFLNIGENYLDDITISKASLPALNSWLALLPLLVFVGRSAF